MSAKHLLNLLWKGPGVFPSLQGCALLTRVGRFGAWRGQGGAASCTKMTLTYSMTAVPTAPGEAGTEICSWSSAF